MRAPQIIWIVIAASSVGISLAKNGKEEKCNFFYTLISAVIEALILYAGGFFG